MATNGSYAGAEELLAATQSALKRQDLELDFGGGVKKHVIVSELTGAEYQTFQESLSSTRREVRGVGGRNPQTDIIVESTNHKATVRLCWLAMKKPDGERLFAFEEQVGKLPHRILEQVWLVAARLSGILPDEPTNVAEAVVEEGKGSGAMEAGSSTSRSRSRSDSPPAGTSTPS